MHFTASTFVALSSIAAGAAAAPWKYYPVTNTTSTWGSDPITYGTDTPYSTGYPHHNGGHGTGYHHGTGYNHGTGVYTTYISTATYQSNGGKDYSTIDTVISTYIATETGSSVYGGGDNTYYTAPDNTYHGGSYSTPTYTVSSYSSQQTSYPGGGSSGSGSGSGSSSSGSSCDTYSSSSSSSGHGTYGNPGEVPSCIITGQTVASRELSGCLLINCIVETSRISDSILINSAVTGSQLLNVAVTGGSVALSQLDGASFVQNATVTQTVVTGTAGAAGAGTLPDTRVNLQGVDVEQSTVTAANLQDFKPVGGTVADVSEQAQRS